jgi:hypothetical protein
VKPPRPVKAPAVPAKPKPAPIKRFAPAVPSSVPPPVIAAAIAADRPLLVDLKRAREMLGIGRSTMAALVGAGDVRSVLIKRRRLIPISELERVARRGAA